LELSAPFSTFPIHLAPTRAFTAISWQHHNPSSPPRPLFRAYTAAPGLV
jgi:hypothetical protein